MYNSVKEWAVAQNITRNVWDVGTTIVSGVWNFSLDYDLTPASFASVFSHSESSENGDLVGHRAIDISSGDGLAAMRLLLENPNYNAPEGAALDVERSYLKRLSRDGVRAIYDSDFAPKVLEVQAQNGSGGSGGSGADAAEIAKLTAQLNDAHAQIKALHIAIDDTEKIINDGLSEVNALVGPVKGGKVAVTTRAFGHSAIKKLSDAVANLSE